MDGRHQVLGRIALADKGVRTCGQSCSTRLGAPAEDNDPHAGTIVTKGWYQARRQGTSDVPVQQNHIGTCCARARQEILDARRFAHHLKAWLPLQQNA